MYHGYYDYAQIGDFSTPANWGPPDAPASVPSSAGIAASVPGEVLVLPYNDRDAVEALLARHGDGIAALILDPLPNRSGCPLPAPGFLAFLRAITRAHGIVLIFDEVISFRVGYEGAQGRYGGDPDLTVYGKIIGGGLSIGAVGGRRDILGLLDPASGPRTVRSGGTLSGNPLAAVAGLAALDQLTSAEYARLERLGARLREEGTALFREAGVPGQIAGDGSLFLILPTDGAVTNYRSAQAAPADLARLDRLHQGLLDAGVIVSRRGLGCLSTPMGDAEVDSFLDGLERALAALPEHA